MKSPPFRAHYSKEGREQQTYTPQMAAKKNSPHRGGLWIETEEGENHV